MRNSLLAAAALIPLGIAGAVVFVPSGAWQSVSKTLVGPGAAAPANAANSVLPVASSNPTSSLASSVLSSSTVVAPPALQSANAMTTMTGNSVSSSQATGFPAAAERLAAMTGRRIVPYWETCQPPYSSVGRFFNEKAPSVTVGSGTVIRYGGFHVLTAAHVIEIGDVREKALGRFMFALPGQKASEVGDAMLDGAWKFKTVSGDIGVCHISDITFNALELEETHFEVDDEPMFGETISIIGYDLDIWFACGCPDDPPMVERSTRFDRMGNGREERAFRSFAEKLEFNENLASIWGETPTAASAGAIAVFSGAAYLKQKADDKFGWASEALGSLGADGGCVLHGTSVLGVVGYPDGEPVGPNKVTVGYLLGTRLTGPVLDIIENF